MKQVPLIRIVDDDPSVGASFRFVLEAVGYQAVSYTHLDVYKRQGLR